MYKIEISSFWIDAVGKSFVFSVIAIVAFIIAIKLICVTIRDWHIKDEFSMNISIFIWGILEISVV